MKLRFPAILFATSALWSVASAQLFVGSDDFNIGATPNWDYSFRIAGSGTSNGLLGFTNNRLDFSKSTGAGSHFRGWNSDENAGTSATDAASFSTSWVANLTVTNTLAFGGGEYATIGFEITNDAGQYSALMIGSDYIRAEGSGFTPVSAGMVDNTDVILQLAWNAGTQALSASYSLDGSAFTPVATFLPLTQWTGGTTSNGFFFEIFGNSNAIPAINTGWIYADDFSISAIPEPSTYAALAGLGALGLALWRRRARA